MRSRVRLTRDMLEGAYSMMVSNVESVSLEESLFVPAGGYRSIIGRLKHAAGWSHVYRSYAFDQDPRHWNQIDWPHGLRDARHQVYHAGELNQVLSIVRSEAWEEGEEVEENNISTDGHRVTPPWRQK